MIGLDQILSPDNLWMVMKIGYLIAYALYVLFAFVVMAQVKQMTKTIDAGLNGTLATISNFHLMVAAGLFVIALVVL